jgi:hypothetical protein
VTVHHEGRAASSKAQPRRAAGNYLRGAGEFDFVRQGGFLGGVQDLGEMREFCLFCGDLGFLQGCRDASRRPRNCVDRRRPSSEVGFKNYAVRCRVGAVYVFCGKFRGFAKNCAFLARGFGE